MSPVYQIYGVNPVRPKELKITSPHYFKPLIFELYGEGFENTSRVFNPSVAPMNNQ